MKKCLYVSDLDGTLLRSDKTISEYTCEVINRLTENGILFSYATARSYVTAKMVTKGLNAKIPLIVYNGAFVIDSVSEEILISNYFDEDIKAVLEELISNGIYPIVYSYIEYAYCRRADKYKRCKHDEYYFKRFFHAYSLSSARMHTAAPMQALYNNFRPIATNPAGRKNERFLNFGNKIPPQGATACGGAVCERQ